MRDLRHSTVLARLNIKADTPVVTYCQLGVRAAFMAALLKKYGVKDVAVFDDSMKFYSRTDAPMVNLQEK